MDAPQGCDRRGSGADAYMEDRIAAAIAQRVDIELNNPFSKIIFAAIRDMEGEEFTQFVTNIYVRLENMTKATPPVEVAARMPINALIGLIE